MVSVLDEGTQVCSKSHKHAELFEYNGGRLVKGLEERQVLAQILLLLWFNMRLLLAVAFGFPVKGRHHPRGRHQPFQVTLLLLFFL